MRNRSLLWIFVLPGLMLYGVMFVYPTLSGLFYSFTDWDGISESFRIIGWDNYRNILESIVFRKTILNNVKFMVAVVIFQSVIALILALLLVRNRKSHVFLRALFFFPAILSSVSVGLIWSFVYDPNIGLLNTVFHKVGLSGLALNWIGDKQIAIYSIAVVQIWAHAGQMMIVFIAGLQSIPSELYEAATIDGGSRSRVFRYITWPLLAPSTTIVVAYTTIQSFKAFDLIFTMTDGGPNFSTEIMTTYIYHLAFSSYAFGEASAGSVLLLLLLSLFTFLQFKALRANRISY